MNMPYQRDTGFKGHRFSVFRLSIPFYCITILLYKPGAA